MNESVDQKLNELAVKPSAMDNAVLKRLIEGIKHEYPNNPNKYNRIHNRHNRGMSSNNPS